VRQVVDWRNVSLLGIDVGFSERRKTTGIASYTFGQPARLHCVGSLPQDRAEVLLDRPLYDAIAIDGPIVPIATSPEQIIRRCERLLSRGPFGNRCKPGFSHFGTGLKLRKAATTIASEMPDYRRHGDVRVVEAFPNAFLGVMLDDETYAAFETIPRGKKSGIFFAQAARDRTFDRIIEYLGWDDVILREQIQAVARETTRVSHEHRAAFVCVLTTACALSDQAVYVGDEVGGSICLPPLRLWADWARTAVEKSSDQIS
jgi:predicted nuclease with RNAse H fold